MKPLARTALAMALALPLAGHAQEQPPAPPMPSSEAWSALRAAAHELNAADNALLPLPQRLERAAAFRHMPDTAARLVRIFGNERPYTIERVSGTGSGAGSGAGNGGAWRAVLPPLRHTDANGFLTEWEALNVDMLVDKTGRGLDTHATWPSISGGNGEWRLGVRGLAYDNQVRYGFGGLWFGTARIGADSVEMVSDKLGLRMRAEGLGVAGRVTEKPRTVDQDITFQVRTIRFGDHAIEDFRLSASFLGMDKQAIVDLNNENNRIEPRAEALSPEQQLEAIKPLMRALGKAMLTKGALVRIDELGLGYQGHRATLRGQVQVVNGKPSDLDTPSVLLGKLAARLEVRLPVPLLREIAGAIAARQVAQQAAAQGRSADPQAIAQLRESVADVIIGKLLGGGFARMEDDVLVSTIEWRNGVLRANGKPVPLPAPKPAGAPPVAVVPGRGDFLQARLVESSCALPAYPEDVIASGRSFGLRIDFVVGVDGRVKRAAIGRASGVPDYDRAALAAFERCTYIPALRGGQPVEVSMSREIVRTAGARQP